MNVIGVGIKMKTADELISAIFEAAADLEDEEYTILMYEIGYACLDAYEARLKERHINEQIEED